jgi:hypothetical protein
MIHPEAVFMVHGFCHNRLPVESRAFMRGLADNKFMKSGLDIWDPVGGVVALQEHFVNVSKDRIVYIPIVSQLPSAITCCGRGELGDNRGL